MGTGHDGGLIYSLPFNASVTTQLTSMNPVPAASTSRAASAAPRKKSKALWWILGLLVVAALGVGVYFKRQQGGKAQAVTIEKAITKTITQVVSATGKVQPEIEVKIAPEVSGEIIKLPFREGMAVKKGDLLLAIKQDVYVAQVDQQEAGLVSARAAAVQAQAQLVQAQDALKRSADIFAKNLISESDYIAAKTNVDVAQANYDSAVAQIRRTEGSLNQMKDQLTKTVIYAPIDGRISSLSTELGERVAGTGSYGGAEVMRVADFSDQEVRVNINENDIVNVKVGDKAAITVDAFPSRKFTGIVKEIGSAAKVTGQNTQDEVTNFLVKIRIVEKDVDFHPGMSGNADVATKTVENVIAVPIQSVTVRSKTGAKTIDQVAADRDKKATELKGDGAAVAVNVAKQKQAEKSDREGLQRVVFVYKDGAVKMVPVETGVQDATHIEIKSGLSAGDEVVSGSFGVITRTLTDGMKVTIEKPKGPMPKIEAAKN
jgi:HlyD family secretion protein